MATPQLSPGVLIREVDLTVGRADNVLDNIGAIAGPFKIGPVDSPIDITTEQELINVFGKPISTDGQYEYWMSASSFLSYGGVLKVVRTDGTNLITANAGVGIANTTNLKIKNFDDYQANYSDDIADYIFAAKTPGSWANDLKVCIIDDKADQIIGVNTTNLGGLGIQVGYAVTTSIDGVVIPGNGSTSTFNGYLKGIITGVSTDATNGNSTIDVKIISRVSTATTQYNNTLVTAATLTAGIGTDIVYVNSTSGLNTLDTLTAPGLNNLVITSVGATSVSLASTISSAINSGVAVTFSRLVTIGGTETPTSYARNSAFASFNDSDTISIKNSSGIGTVSVEVASEEDWYDQQTLALTNSTIYWKSIAPKPVSTNYTLTRNGRNDTLHIAVIDDTGSVTGIQGNLLEKHLNLSKAADAVSDVNSPQKNFWKEYLALFSNYVYVGDNPSSGVDTYNNTKYAPAGFESDSEWSALGEGDGLWNQDAQGVIFSSLGNVTYTLKGGVDYSTSGGMSATLGDLITSYNLFSNRDEIAVDYLIMGPGLNGLNDSQAKANLLISIAGQRKDCVAVISPHRGALLTGSTYESYGPITNRDTQTDNVIEFFSPLSSSSYAIFDSGYKYTYDRFNNKFRWIPCNPDVAGLMVRTNINAYPWFSPAGQQRGILNNAIKLAFNPSKAQRDQLYTARVNSIVNQPGIGILLFGDKTGLGYASAFDRINVRRLFLTVEQALERTAQAQLFELNDEITRANFRNIVEPYLRDVQAKRGLYGFLVVCDASNNTPDVIDNNEFRADIFLKPTKSINYVTLTFVATRTGVSFEELAGTV